MLCIAVSAYAGDYLTGFDESKDLPLLNEHLRKIDQALLYGRLRTSDSDDSMGYLDTEVLDIVTVGSISGGVIGGWTLAEAGLSGGSGSDYIGLRPGEGIMMGSEILANAVFSVTSQGALKATSGTIGGWDLTADTIESASDNIVLTDSTSEITVGSTGGVHIQIDGANKHIRSSDYVSGALGSGWNIDTSVAEFNNIRARGKITTAVFEKETISSIGGNFLVSDSDILDADMTADDTVGIVDLLLEDGGSILLEDGSRLLADWGIELTISGDTTFAVGDILRIKDGIDDEWFEVLDATAAPTYAVARDKAGDYALNTNPIWKKGTCIVNFGASGEGVIFMTASEINAPHIDVITHAGVPWTTLTTHMRMGNLNGYLDYASDLYGIAIGKSDAYLKYDPTNGLRIKGNVTLTGGSLSAEYITSGYLNVDRLEAGTITADKITAGTFIGGNFVIGNGGAFQSDNYVADTSGFRLNHEALELNQGTTILGEGILETIMIYSMVFGGN